jgi:hypothetical protein
MKIVARWQSCKVAKLHVVNLVTLQPCNPVIFTIGNMSATPKTMKMQLVRGLTRMNADPDNPRESAFIRVPFSQ